MTKQEFQDTIQRNFSNINYWFSSGWENGIETIRTFLDIQDSYGTSAQQDSKAHHILRNGIVLKDRTGIFAYQASSQYIASNIPTNAIFAPMTFTFNPGSIQLDPELRICNHTWAPYEGFTERYNYCTKCDEKG
jgi:hypothetical protein